MLDASVGVVGAMGLPPFAETAYRVAHMTDNIARVRQLVGIAITKNTIAAVSVSFVCFGMGALMLVVSNAVGGTVFGFLFFVVGVFALGAILHVDGSKLRMLLKRIDDSPDQVAWIHLSPIANRLRRRDVTVIVFFVDRQFVRFALPKTEGGELVELLRERCPEARFTRDLSLPVLLEHEGRWRKDPDGFRKQRGDTPPGNESIGPT